MYKKNLHQLPIAAAIGLCMLTGCEKPLHDLADPSEEIGQLQEDYAELELKKIKSDGSVSPEYLESIEKIQREHYLNFTSRYKSARDVSGAGYDVGVIPAVQGCPLSSEEIVIYLDNENNTPHQSGYYNPSGPTSTQTGFSWHADAGIFGTGDAYIRFCKVDGRLFSNAGGRFDVLKVGPNNPTNWQSIRLLHLDNQDGGNTHFVSPASEAGLNNVDGNKNVNLYWLAFNNNFIASFPNLGFEYSVLGNPLPGTTMASATFYTDDEDSGTANYASFYAGGGTMYDGDFEFVTKAGSSEKTGTRFYMKKVK